MAQIHKRETVTNREMGGRDTTGCFIRTLDMIYEDGNVTIGDGSTGPFIAFYLGLYAASDAADRSPDGALAIDCTYVTGSPRTKRIVSSDNDALGGSSIARGGTTTGGGTFVVKRDGSLFPKTGTIDKDTTVSSASQGAQGERIPLDRNRTPSSFTGYWRIA